MSQFFNPSSGGGGGGSGILTLTGTIGPAVGPDGGGNVNINTPVGSTIIVDGTIAANTLQIRNSSESIVTVQTTDATPTALFTFAVGASSAVTFQATVLGAKADYSAAIGGTSLATARRGAAGGPALVTDVQSFDEDSGTGDPFFNVSISGNNVILFVTGEAGVTYNWKAYVTQVTLP